MNSSERTRQLKSSIGELHRIVCSRYAYNLDYNYFLNKAGEYTLMCDKLEIHSPSVRKQLDATKNMCWYHLLKEERNGTN